MFRYIAFFWDDADPHACATAAHLIHKCPGWQTAHDQPGFSVLHTGPDSAALVRRVDANGGVILGHFFATEPDRSLRDSGDLAADRSARILGTGGRYLINTYWGNYIALLRHPLTRTRWVLRGPATSLPCLHATIESVDVYFSWTESFARLREIPLSINWPHLARELVGPLLSTETGIREIREIPPGFCEEVQGTRQVLHCYWNPEEVAESAPITDFHTAASTLRETTKACIDAWARKTPRLLHALSGGLDSSIVFACLRDAPSNPEITCLTQFAEGPDSDERSFARAATRGTGCRHVELRRTADVELRSVLHGVRLERTPGMRIPEVDRLEPDLARASGATAIYKGHGGDEIFCRHHTHFYVADFLRRCGLRRKLLDLAAHSAIAEGETIWTVLTRALWNACVPRRWDLTGIFRHDQEGQSLLHAEVLASLRKDRSFDLPFAQTTRKCPPGKLWQISLITGHRAYYSPFSRDTDPHPIWPLLSQPIIEVALRIPTYLQMEGRRERAVARAAFANDVPPEIINRTDKGGAEPLAWKVFRKNQRFIRELLMDGALVRERIVDAQRLEAVLSGSPDSAIRATVPVFALVGAEAWHAAWQNPAFRTAP